MKRNYDDSTFSYVVFRRSQDTDEVQQTWPRVLTDPSEKRVKGHRNVRLELCTSAGKLDVVDLRAGESDIQYRKYARKLRNGDEWHADAHIDLEDSAS